ncbi:TetR/AcrR family transcriptional regulator [Microbulbifer sp. JTAC008]|uniref:TetR/AcrR family transcriptional regulator n=1 Tax=unclassified Microbulbifer TaxID=2619833 RepID=UPI0040398CEA
MEKLDTRDRIIATADDLFYQQGFEHTSFKDVANLLNISRGNFYHHFKTKDQILSGVIERRLQKTQAMLEEWEAQGNTSEQRIKCYIRIVITNWDKIRDFGCPVGTLSNELAKLNHVGREDANKIFSLFREWLKTQFTQLNPNTDADKLALQVLSWSQGVATLANAFQDKDYVEYEVNKMCSWVDTYKAKA